MSVIAIIPARLASTRFPNKPLALIAGIPLVAHCIFRARLSKKIKEVFLATCDDEIASIGLKAGAKIIRTDSHHHNAISRTAEAVSSLNHTNQHSLKVVMIQGDEPLVSVKAIDAVASELDKSFLSQSFQIINAVTTITSEKVWKSPDCPKVVLSKDCTILYASRAPIPYQRQFELPVFGHLQTGLIGFTEEALRFFCETELGPLETFEGIDILRFIENQKKVFALNVADSSIGVDRPQDIMTAQDMLCTDATFRRYRHQAQLFVR